MGSWASGGLLLWGWFLLASAPAPEPDLELGKRVYMDRCKPCHGSRGDGQTFAANVLNPPPRNFVSDKSRQELTRRRMVQSVTRGRSGTAMMPWKNILKPGEIRAVVHFIRKRLMRAPD